ncbi:MAG: nucleotidyltransferase domain-containing protein [Nitrospirota bacterium]
MIKYEKLPRGVLSAIPNVKKILLEDDNVIFAYLFGGLARGEVKVLSDIDIAVYVKNISSLAEYKLRLFEKI